MRIEEKMIITFTFINGIYFVIIGLNNINSERKFVSYLYQIYFLFLVITKGKEFAEKDKEARINSPQFLILSRSFIFIGAMSIFITLINIIEELIG
jgi:hypothetical protein